MTSLEHHIQTITAPETPPNSIAFFDLDRTLIAGYSIFGLATESAKYVASRGYLKHMASVVREVRHNETGDSESSYLRLVKQIAYALTGVSEETLLKLGENVYEKHTAKSLYSEAISLVKAHRDAGHHLVIVSAASLYQVEPVARVLGIKEFYCTQLEVKDGVFTGQIGKPPCHGEGKVLAARGAIRRHESTFKKSWFYSDSADDLPLLNKVGRPVAVNASGNLSRRARVKGWPQLQFTSRGLPRVEDLSRTALTAQTVISTTTAGIIGQQMGLGKLHNANQMTQLLGDVGSGFAGLRYEIEGKDYLCEARPAIFTFNHQSLLDAVVLAHLLRHDVVAFVKKEMANNPIVAPLLRRLDTIFVDRENQNQAELLKQALETLASGRSLAIAPEGTRSTLGNIQPFKHGAFLIAKKAGVPLVPVVLHNVKDALPKGGKIIRPANIRVTVLPPVLPDAIGSVRQASTVLESRYKEILENSNYAACQQGQLS